MNFIYVIDSNLKDTLLSKGYKLIKEITDKNECWIFENSNNINFSVNAFDKSKYLITNRLVF